MQPSPRPQQPSMGAGLVIVALFFCFPLGLFLMWTRTNWSQQSKHAVTGVLALLLVGGMMYENSPAGKAERAAQEAETARLMEAASRAAEDEKKRKATEEAAEVARVRQKVKENTARAAAEAERAKKEFASDGLVLLLPTLKATYEDGFAQITGLVENRRSAKLTYAQVTFNLYDKSGAQVGSALANINGLEPGGKWKFKAPVLEDSFKTYKVSELTGF